MNKSTAVKIVALPSLETFESVELGGDVIDYSILLTRVEGSNYLLVGLSEWYSLTRSLN